MNNKTKQLVLSALLIALGIVIPMFSLPVVPIAAMSVTLGAHVPVILSMFVSPVTAVATALGTTLGFFLKGTDFVVVMRALSHLIFALCGALIIYRGQKKQNATNKAFWASVVIAYIVTLVLHVFAELLVIYLITPQAVVMTTAAFVFAVHHTFDFAVTLVIMLALKRAKLIK